MPRVIETKAGQKLVTIPKAIAAAMDLKRGDVVEFKLGRSGKFELVKTEQE